MALLLMCIGVMNHWLKMSLSLHLISNPNIILFHIDIFIIWTKVIGLGIIILGNMVDDLSDLCRRKWKTKLWTTIDYHKWLQLDWWMVMESFKYVFEYFLWMYIIEWWIKVWIEVVVEWVLNWDVVSLLFDSCIALCIFPLIP